MSSTGLSTWIYASFRRTKRRFQRLQRPAFYSFSPLDVPDSVPTSLESALIPSNPDAAVAVAAAETEKKESLVVINEGGGVEKDSAKVATDEIIVPFRKRGARLSIRRKKRKDSRQMAPEIEHKGEEQEAVLEIARRDDEIAALKTKLAKEKEDTKLLLQRENILRDRLAAQALHVLEKSDRFENVNSYALRPLQIVSLYEDLYSQDRVDAMDALENLEELADLDDLKTKILYSVIVLSYRAAHCRLDAIKSGVADLLRLPQAREDQTDVEEAPTLNPKSLLSKTVEDAIADWLRLACLDFDASSCLKEVENQLHATLFDFPSLCECKALRDFVVVTLGVAWCCVTARPPLVLEYQATEFKSEWHQRFANANADSDRVTAYVWPGLFEIETGACLSRGVVIT